MQDSSAPHEVIDRARSIEGLATEIRNLVSGMEVGRTEEGVEGEYTLGYLMVGKAECPPGGECEIEILGHSSSLPVQGFGLGIGIHADLELAEYKIAQPLRDLLLPALSDPFSFHDVGRWGGPGYNPGNYLHAYVGFFEISPRLGPIEAIIPPMTKLMTLRFHVPTHFAPGTTIELLNRDNWFGRPLKSAGAIKRLKIRNQFITSREVAQFGIYPDLVSGFIQVI